MTPFWTSRCGLVSTYVGDALDVLRQMPDNSVHCCVTSPPYYGLRDYGTASWDGGDPECDHQGPKQRTMESVNKNTGEGNSIKVPTMPFKEACGKCGAVRLDQQIGLEKMPAEFIAKLVEVFREVRRMLHPSGTCWVNMGDSYCNSDKWGGGGSNTGKHTIAPDGSTPSWAVRARKPMTNVSYFLHRLFEEGVIFYGQTRPARHPAERPQVFIYDESSPDRVLFPLLGVQRVFVKERDNDLCQIGDLFDSPVDCFVSASFCRAIPTRPDVESVVNILENVTVVVAARNLDADPSLRRSTSLPVKNREATFAIEVAGEPVAKGVINSKTIRHTLILNATAESGCYVDLVNETVPFADRFNATPGQGRDFQIGEASAEKIDFLFVGGRIKLAFACERHLYNSSLVGITPYRTIYEQAIKEANVNRPKQELGVPDFLKRALMEDGWICRQTIIWAKPSPMPESVTDRCTKSHEYVFLLSKNSNYFYDHEAIKERSLSDGVPMKTADGWDTAEGAHGTIHRNGREQGQKNGDVTPPLKNRRSVWNVASAPYAEAHFATYPPELIRPMIRAGTSEKGVCPKCLAPWVRNDYVKRVPERPLGDKLSKAPDDVRSSASARMGRGAGWRKEKARKHAAVKIRLGATSMLNTCSNSTAGVAVQTKGWEPSCKCAAGDPIPATVIDIFGGSGTTGMVARQEGRRCVLIELNPKYAAMHRLRVEMIATMKDDEYVPLFNE